MSARVAVIGAGISGLAAAIELQSHGLDVLVFEASNRAGGPIRTELDQGYVIDAGPDSFLSYKPGGLALASRLAIQNQIVNTSPDGGGTFIVHNGEMEPLPEGITMLVPTQLRQIAESRLLDLPGKARLLADYFIPSRRGAEDESVAAFMRRRVGNQAFSNLAEPLLSGIFAGDAEKLSILSTFPRLREMEQRHGGLIRAALAARQASSGNGTGARRFTPFVSFDRGLGMIIDAAIAFIGRNRIKFDCPVESIEPLSTGYRIHTSREGTIEANGVLVTAPGGAAAEILAEAAPGVARTVSMIPYVSSATVSLAFQKSDIGETGGGRGFVIPRVEGFDLTAVTWSSRKFARRAPEGRVLLRGFVGRAGNEEPAFLPDDEVVEIVRRDLAAITGISADPLFAKVFRWHKSMPQYHVGHSKLIDEVEGEIGSIKGLAVAGAPYRGVGIPDCITYATEQARKLAAEVGASA